MRGRKPELTADARAIADPLKPPAWLSKLAKVEWRRVMPILNERRILTDADLGSLENYCTAIGTVREMERRLQQDGHIVQTEKGLKRHPATAIQAEAMTRARLLAAELGLTPVSRSRPSIRDDENDDDDSSALGV